MSDMDIHRYRNISTQETIEFPDPQPAFAQHEEWVPEHLAEDAAAPEEELEVSEQWSRGDLDELAASLGVDEPEKLPNKGAVIEAIEAAQAAAQGL